MICVILSAWHNYQTASPPKEQREMLDLLSIDKAQVNWITILSQLPQYRKEDEVKKESDILKEQQISDSQIIGIVVDNPKSVLLLIGSKTEVISHQLSVGEGWLTDWKIQKIEPDSITWVNTRNQQIYIQTLFASVENESKISQPKTGTP